MGRIVKKKKKGIKMHSNLSLLVLLRIHSLLRLVAQKQNYDLISVYVDNPMHFSGAVPNCH